jgi:S1-C subfamily serine protease
MSLVDVQGRGVMVERLDLQSFAVPLLQPGDIILGVDERRVAMSAELRRYLRAAPAGKMVVFTIQRDHTRHYVMLQLPP